MFKDRIIYKLAKSYPLSFFKDKITRARMVSNDVAKLISDTMEEQ